MSPGSDRAGSDLGLRGGVRDLDDPCGRLSLPARNPANVLRAPRDVRRPLVLSSQPAHLRVALDRVPHRCAGRGRGGVARVEGVESRGRRRDGPTPGRGGVLDRLRLPISWVLGAARASDDMDRLANQLDAGHKAASEQNAASVRPADAAEVVKLPVGRRKSAPEQGIWLPEATQYFASFPGPSRDTCGTPSGRVT